VRGKILNIFKLQIAFRVNHSLIKIKDTSSVAKFRVMLKRLIARIEF